MGARDEYTAGTMEEPSGLSPSASPTMPMVLAVYCPAQAPAVGRQSRLICSSSCSLARPAMTWPIISYASTMFTSRPPLRPGRALPPYMNTAGTLQRTMPITRPGMFLSQPPRPKMPSH